MKTLKSLADAEDGQRLSFAYYGGENSGGTRVVDVTSIGDDRMFGIDVAKNEPRQYLFENAALISIVERATPVAAEAACDVEPEAEAVVPTRVRRLPMSFPAARDLLHQQIEALNGEDLAEVLAEIQGEDRARFDATSGQVILERDVLIPHCVVNDKAHNDAAGIDWVNEEGEALTTTFYHKDNRVLLFSDKDKVSAENLIREIARHLGLTIS